MSCTAQVGCETQPSSDSLSEKMLSELLPDVDWEEVIRMTDDSPAKAKGAEPATLSRARTAAREYVDQLHIGAKAAEDLSRLIDEAIDERVGEVDDLRIGRVMGAALATL